MNTLTKQTRAAFFTLADDEDRVRYKAKAPIWIGMAYASIPLWKKIFFSKDAVTAMVLKEALKLARESELWVTGNWAPGSQK
jgi:hypothetical protein